MKAIVLATGTVKFPDGKNRSFVIVPKCGINNTVGLVKVWTYYEIEPGVVVDVVYSKKKQRVYAFPVSANVDPPVSY